MPVNTALSYPYAPMEAQLMNELPLGSEWQYEPKWDGFRCIIYRDGSELELQSKTGQSLGRYFPEVLQSIRSLKSRNFVLDSEIVIPVRGRLSFDDLLMRIHPAESRIRKLSAEFPALVLVFDLLAEGEDELTGEPLSSRRSKLERFARRNFSGKNRVLLSPATRDIELARRWLTSGGTNIDGVVAKRADYDYRTGDRSGMRKVKRIRTADCVIGGFRYASSGRIVGSLLLGLYSPEGLLDHVGFTSGLKSAEKPALTRQLESITEPPGFTGRRPGGPSRWSTERSGEWQPVRPDLVVEVQYDHFTGGRFRHGTRLLRWRPDKSPRQCTLDQVEMAPLEDGDFLIPFADRF